MNLIKSQDHQVLKSTGNMRTWNKEGS